MVDDEEAILKERARRIAGIKIEVTVVRRVGAMFSTF